MLFIFNCLALSFPQWYAVHFQLFNPSLFLMICCKFLTVLPFPAALFESPLVFFLGVFVFLGNLLGVIQNHVKLVRTFRILRRGKLNSLRHWRILTPVDPHKSLLDRISLYSRESLLIKINPLLIKMYVSHIQMSKTLQHVRFI